MISCQRRTGKTMAESKEKETQTMCHRKVKIEKEEPPQMVDMNKMDYFQIYPSLTSGLCLPLWYTYLPILCRK
jgi:hypothetical protein